MKMWRFLYRISVVVAIGLLVLGEHGAGGSKSNARPNIVFILVDDQDFHLASMDRMEILQSQLIQQGTLFTNHYGQYPARATLWTGRHAHNTNVTSVVNGRAGGGWKQIQRKGLNKKYLPVWLENAGYQTYYSGKIFHGFGIDNYCKPGCLEGLTRADILVDPRTYSYYNSTYAHFDGSQWTIDHLAQGYSTDQIAQNAAGFIEEAVQSDAPFFAVAAPVAPHISTGASYRNGTQYSLPVPKQGYMDLFNDIQLPKSPNFSPDNRTGVNAVWRLERLDESNIGVLEQLYRMRQRALKSVDDMIDTIVQKLDETGVLDNTYILYTSGNGYHIGNHRLQGGKQQCFEEDIHIPLIVRGPNVGKNKTMDFVTSHIDIVPTILRLARAEYDPTWELDGTAISFPLKNEVDYFRNLGVGRELVHLEFWGAFDQEGAYRDVDVRPNKNLNTYKALRIQGDGYNLLYVVWCQEGAHELYDMSWDQYQMTNLHPDAPAEDGSLNAYRRGLDTIMGRPTEQVINRLDALVLVQKTCVADACREPWNQLHPEGKVKSLVHAVHEKLDDFYTRSYSLAKVGWKQCYDGQGNSSGPTLFDLDNEQPTWLNQTVVQLVRSGATRTATRSKWALLFAWVLAVMLG